MCNVRPGGMKGGTGGDGGGGGWLGGGGGGGADGGKDGGGDGGGGDGAEKAIDSTSVSVNEMVTPRAAFSVPLACAVSRAELFALAAVSLGMITCDLTVRVPACSWRVARESRKRLEFAVMVSWILFASTPMKLERFPMYAA